MSHGSDVRLLRCIREVQTRFINEADSRVVFDSLLTHLLELTDSAYGFIGEVLWDKSAKPYLRTHSITDISWNEETRRLYADQVSTGMEFHNLETLFGAVIVTGETVISNDPATDSRRGGLPPGHPGLDSFLGLPLLKGGKLIGVAGVANRAQGYDTGLVEYLEPYLATCESILNAHLLARARRQADEERRELEDRLQQVQKLESLGVLAGGIAHDFNNLLTGIMGNASLAVMRLPDDSEARDHVLRIEKSAQRAAELCQQMLAYSGKGRFVTRAIDLSLLVEEMVHLLERCISRKASLTLNLSEDPAVIVADATQIRQVVMNLITNASDAIGDGSGTIDVQTGSMYCDRAILADTWLDDDLDEGDYVFVDVRDTGSGMDAETLGRVFDPFFTTKFAGQGLGMAAVIGIVRGHAGAIRIDSRSDQGTRVRVLLPKSDRPVERDAIETSLPAVSGDGGLILVVDDEEPVRAYARSSLEQSGYDVVEAEDGQRALDVFQDRADEIRAVLLDLTMPRLNGDEVLRELLRIRPDATVILSSGYGEQEIEERFAGRGLSGFLQKPYRPAELLGALGSALDRAED